MSEEFFEGSAIRLQECCHGVLAVARWLKPPVPPWGRCVLAVAAPESGAMSRSKLPCLRRDL